MREPLAGLTALLSVAEKRSFAGAAAELGVTPSAIIYHPHSGWFDEGPQRGPSGNEES